MANAKNSLNLEGKCFGDIIKELRRKKGITLRNLAGIVGVSSGYLSEVENRKKGPPRDPDVIKRLAKALKVDEELLFRLRYEEKTPLSYAKNLYLKHGQLGVELVILASKSDKEKVKKAVEVLKDGK